MGSKRRYKVDLYPVYSDAFDRGRINSEILNPTKNAGVHTEFLDKKTLELMKYKYKGDEEGWVNLPEQDLGHIPAQHQHLADIEKKFEDIQQTAVNEGRYPLDKMPPELFREKLLAFAKVDVMLEELELIDKMIQEWKEPVKELETAMVLKYGPRGTGRLRFGIVDVLDGQKCGQTADGLLIITDPKSPYRHMAVADYRLKIVRPWTIARIFLERQQGKFYNEAGISDSKSTEFKQAWAERVEELYRDQPDKI